MFGLIASKCGRKLAAACFLSAVVLTLGACHTPVTASAETHSADTPYQVTIKRTQDGVPHIDAADWGSLGFAVGYAQAQDALCTLSDGFVTWRGERSAVFGPKGRPSTPSTFGQPDNLDADFFFRSVIDDAAVARFRSAQPSRERALITGYADGYNRYVDDLHAGRFPGAHAACSGDRWVAHISADDLYRRLIAANLAGGTMPFHRGIAHAQLPGSAASAASTSGQTAPRTIADRLSVGGRAGIGSNGLAFGAAATQDGQSVLFGNPHWFWQGPDRLYQMQLRIGGQVDVAGASFLGVPMVMIGFNQNVAWTHTVSSARRFGIFQLTLAPGAPTHYRYDGQDEAMHAVLVTVQVRDMTTGTLAPVTRTMYRTRFGPVVDLSSLSPALAWNDKQAFALFDVNADNPETFSNFLQWDQARSLDDFIAIQKREAAMPWVNTFAIGRNDPDVWFADIGAMPGVTDKLAADCTTPAGRVADARMPGVPFLDGSRAACAWTTHTLAGATRAGRLPADSMPSLKRADYVGNFNGSYWLTNPHAPLTGYPQVVGQTGIEQSLRTRLGHAIAAQLIAEPGGVRRDALERAVLASTSMSAQLYLQPVTDAVCQADTVRVTLDSATPARTQDVKIGPACAVLRSWDGTANVNARGANLWDEFWNRASAMPELQRYTTPFDASHPLTTPAGIDTADPAVVRALGNALGGAVLALQANGFAADLMRGAMLGIGKGETRVPLYGGCDREGYFTVACAMQPLDRDGYALDQDAHGNSYMQVVSFDADGPQADTMLTTGVSDDPASPYYRQTTRAYASKTWTRFPFTSRALDASPRTVTSVLSGPRSAIY
ncbi:MULTISPECIES: penicillin acylase family protein [unclassified Caballeronia]|uniref:penicillin acylase family protein n=1 Tax=unclassified Caballeronia TaxID=2646786 RepID=UPI0028629224|nr:MULTISPECIES: penicillin acylase family protein [unclassified Caballeronia]MDR5776817.1 penicillin acylase family protein [Caballeronia sp. LZ002]MDR5798676.1 penicillin acylase family protein [Caballeronia sp. LZ001]MDR5852257.1 penicillin acylase family protein [Caballeronia sp. LZ003]